MDYNSNNNNSINFILDKHDKKELDRLKCEVTSNKLESIELLDSYSKAVINVVDAVNPSVVSIYTSNKTINNQFQPTGSGSGVIFTPDGYILTNSHVISNQKELKILLTNGDELIADLIGNDPNTDLAILKINTAKLPYAVIGNSDKLKVGQLVIAMGNPFGFQSTVSTGVVSSLGRSLRAQNNRLIENIIQHTAPLNPGNSGGPLLDSNGKIVGINTAIISQAQGIGFAIPSKTVEWIVTQLMTKGKVKRFYIGIVGQTRTIGPKFQRFHKLKNKYLVEIIHIDNNGPASNAGLHIGDFIVGLNGTDIKTLDDIQHFLSEWEEDKPLTAKVLRREKELYLIIYPREVIE